MTAGCGDYPVWAAALARRSSTLPERLAPPSSSTARMRPRVDARLFDEARLFFGAGDRGDISPASATVGRRAPAKASTSRRRYVRLPVELQYSGVSRRGLFSKPSA